MSTTTVETTEPVSEGGSLGTVLAQARAQRGLGIEEAAKLTRIRAQLLRDIEADDLGRFSHPSYARMFLLDYAKFLGVSPSLVRDQLPDSGNCGTEEYQYLNNLELFRNARKPKARASGKFAGPRAFAFFAKLAVLLALLAAAGYGYLLLRNLDRLEIGTPPPVPAEEPVPTDAVPGVPVGEADAVPLPDPDASATEVSASLWTADESFLLLESPEGNPAVGGDASAPGDAAFPELSHARTARDTEAPGFSLESDAEIEFGSASENAADL